MDTQPSIQPTIHSHSRSYQTRNHSFLMPQDHSGPNEQGARYRHKEPRCAFKSSPTPVNEFLAYHHSAISLSDTRRLKRRAGMSISKSHTIIPFRSGAFSEPPF